MLDYGCRAQLAPHRPAPPAAASPPQVMYAFIQTAAERYRSPGLAGRRAGRINDHKIADFCRAVGGMGADTIARLKITLEEVKVTVLRSIKTRSQSANGSEMIYY